MRSTSGFGRFRSTFSITSSIRIIKACLYYCIFIRTANTRFISPTQNPIQNEKVMPDNKYRTSPEVGRKGENYWAAVFAALAFAASCSTAILASISAWIALLASLSSRNSARAFSELARS